MHHSYVGLRKRESKTSTKWSARNPPPSLGSRDWQLLANLRYCFRILEFSGMEREVTVLLNTKDLPYVAFAFLLALIKLIYYYNNFIGHCGVFCRLKWKIQRAKIYISPLL